MSTAVHFVAVQVSKDKNEFWDASNFTRLMVQMSNFLRTSSFDGIILILKAKKKKDTFTITVSHSV